MNRRRFLLTSAGLSLAGLASRSLPAVNSSTNWWMPDESAPHVRTWMGFVCDRRLWGRRMVRPVLRDLALIANTIAAHEPVWMLTPAKHMSRAKRWCSKNVRLIPMELDDFWVRDTGPVFVASDDDQLGAVNLNFNGWGNKQRHGQDRFVAERIAELAGATIVQAPFVGEGGGIEVDGAGTAIITESCFVNDNRNPELTREELTQRLKATLGLRKIIWLPGIKGMDITDGHTDFYARFTAPGTVVAALEQDPQSYDYDVTREHLSILRDATDASGERLSVHTLEAPRTWRARYDNQDFAPGYVNYYVVNGAVIAPEFGDPPRDEQCRETLKLLYPDREVIQINIDAIASGGGGIHCTTQQQPEIGASSD